MDSGLYESSFSGLKMLYGKDSLKKLQNLSVAVIGIGGVGSWTAEGLARSGVGKITLIDLDDICTSNINRQIHSLLGTVGQFKVDVMKDRILSINPDCHVDTFCELFSTKNAQKILDLNCDYYIDSFDSYIEKVELIKLCLEQSKKLICVGSVGGKIDPTKVLVSDLSRSRNDRLLYRVRKILRKDYSIDTTNNMGIQSIYSSEKARFIDENDEVNVITDGPRKNNPQKLNCFRGFGSVSHLTGVFGLIASSLVINEYLES